MDSMKRSSSQAGQCYDTVRINDLSLIVTLSTGAHWPQENSEPVEQPISVSLSIFYDVSQTVKTDDLSYSINYAKVAKEIRSSFNSTSFICIQDVSRHISDTVGKLLANVVDGLEIHVRVVQLKAPLHCKTVAVEHFARFSSNGSWTPTKITHFVEDLICPTVIGINASERLEKQDVVANLSIDTGERGFAREDRVDLRFITRILYEEISNSDFLTLEALTSFVTARILSVLKSYTPSPVVSLRIAKPSALVFASSAEIHLLRTFDDYPDQFGTDVVAVSDIEKAMTFSQPPHSEIGQHTAAIAFGSNLGDSFQNIEHALRLLEVPEDFLQNHDTSFGRHPAVTIMDTSFLYETAPMYVTDQPSFINCACMVETNLSPRTLLRLMKAIEAKVGRVPSIRNGPRAVDLDIIFYDSAVVDTRHGKGNLDHLDGELFIPHPRVQEREFVLRPLNDMIPDYVHPIFNKTVETLLREVCDPTGPPMNKVIPFPRFPTRSSLPPPSSISPVPETLIYWSYPCSDSSDSALFAPRASDVRETHVMATLNVTPDSFSDGAIHNVLPAALAYVRSSVAAGATIVDVGGYSTRPGAAFVSVDDEITRVVPAIEAMRGPRSVSVKPSAEEGTPSEDFDQRIIDVPISVDTFRWDVAEVAINAGANCINDVYAFTGPDSWPPALAGSPESDRAAEYMANMKAVARKYAVPVVLMHSRGDAGKNKDYSEYAYTDERGAKGAGEVLEGVRVELGAKVDAIVRGKGGVRRWLVIADPGIGFSKTLEGNLEVLRRAKEVVADVQIGDATRGGPYRNPLRGYPQLIGVSRKSFLGAILAQDPEGRETKPTERIWATAAAVSCAVQQEALVLRVHDVKEMMDVVKVAEALWC